MRTMRSLTSLVFLLCALTACASTPRTEAAGRVAHTVFFWLRSDAPAPTRDAMIRYYQHEVLRAPGVASVFAGEARPSDRDVVDDSFSVGTTIVFESSAAEVAWQTEPIHDELKRLFFPLVERVVVYDTLVTHPL